MQKNMAKNGELGLVVIFTNILVLGSSYIHNSYYRVHQIDLKMRFVTFQAPTVFLFEPKGLMTPQP